MNSQMQGAMNEMDKSRAYLQHGNPYAQSFYPSQNDMAKLSEMANSSQASMMNVNPLYSSQFYNGSMPSAMSAYLHPGMAQAATAAAVAACGGQPMGVNGGMNLKYDMNESLRRPVPYVFPGQYLRE